MNRKITILIDTSGSINENGKSAVVKYLLYSIRDIFNSPKYRDYEISFYGWGDLFFEIENLSKIKFKGRLSNRELEKNIDVFDGNSAVLFLTDGNFESKISKSLEKIKKNNISLYCVAVGPDADKLRLKKLSSYPVIFTPDNITRAILTMYGNCEVSL